MPLIKKKQLRLRIFAGPNGSGKSTVIEYVRKYKVEGKTIDFGYYINADDIARQLSEGSFTFDVFDIVTSNVEFQATALTSGLINHDFPENVFGKAYTFSKNSIALKDKTADERLSQILADFLRKKLLKEKKRFSFELFFLMLQSWI